jgi:hypothetical protein
LPTDPRSADEPQAVVIYGGGRRPIMITTGSLAQTAAKRPRSRLTPRLRRSLVILFTVLSLGLLAGGGYHLYRWIAFDEPVRRGRTQGCLRAYSVCGGDALNMGFGIGLTVLGLALAVTGVLLAAYWRRTAARVAAAQLADPES